MLRIALIVTTIIATTLGSLGLPVYLHTCRMQAMVTEAAGCSMCDARKDARPVVPAAAHDRARGCCDDTVVHQKTDDGTMTRVELPGPAFVGILPLISLELLPRPSPTYHASEYGPSPPALAARAQSTYLLNATFLI